MAIRVITKSKEKKQNRPTSVSNISKMIEKIDRDSKILPWQWSANGKLNSRDWVLDFISFLIF
jgi:hypothetical protein